MKKRLVISLLSIWLLIACGNDSDQKELILAQKIAKMEGSDELPSLERTDTVEDIEADKNGIRDDIDEYIKKTYQIEEQQKAVIQYAKSLQASLLVDTEDKIAVKAIINDKTRAISCISVKTP